MRLLSIGPEPIASANSAIAAHLPFLLYEINILFVKIMTFNFYSKIFIKK